MKKRDLVHLYYFKKTKECLTSEAINIGRLRRHSHVCLLRISNSHLKRLEVLTNCAMLLILLKKGAPKLSSEAAIARKLFLIYSIFSDRIFLWIED